MPKLKIKSGDNVMVISGKDKGKQGKVLTSFPKENKVIVDNVNVVTKHRKPRSAEDKGGIVKVNQKIDISNVMVVCSSCKKPSRVGFTFTKTGEKVRTCKNCGKVIANKIFKSKAETKTENKVESKPVVKITTPTLDETKTETMPVEKIAVEKKPVVKSATAEAKTETKSTTAKKTETKTTAPKAVKEQGK